MKKALVLIGVAFLVFGIYLFASQSNSQETLPKVDFKTTEVLQGELTVKISATGVVEPNFQVEVKSKASGEVLNFPYEEGDSVQKGDLLLRLDKSDEQRNVAKAKADLGSSIAKLEKAKTALLLQKTKYQTDLQKARSAVQAAEANFREAEAKRKRQQDLFEKKFVSREALDTAETAYQVTREELIQARAQLQAARDQVHDITMKQNEIDLAEAEVQRMQIAVEEAMERLEETDIYAPITGVIIQKMVEEGQIIASGISNVSGGTPLATLADLSRLFIIADIDETDIGKVEEKLPVRITADAYPGKTFEGRVARIAPKGEVESSITIFKVKIEILGQGKSILKPMMTANVNIIAEQVNPAIYLPREAVRKNDSGEFVVLLEDGRPQKIPVTTGIQTPIHVQILSDLTPGQKVILGDWKKQLEQLARA
ncbi:MAG: efflux RND transporter periplasmic adaptor subunit, partial [Nitrospinaceae bacterium]|nr:efflux RND transporter periplasmic adaptor subunit [Nitrospinaceae bacterium]NIR54422.1 efflux RND transporter periplasmic adaptor subunit [Nitrospinaceae bacterium]NIS84836.1 efflux RND transporter periplasmic adaptor subunit [Nitrospinaceae bacterium]NIT81641.1 efflux RND transporter periplasmic adaptor subunit [Nitrospinaceae bacterium]NIU43924.1 efflux RND transporter periplasmic adaptor subunit [Nitrospinaceae bacterium]